MPGRSLHWNPGFSGLDAGWLSPQPPFRHCDIETPELKCESTRLQRLHVCLRSDGLWQNALHAGDKDCGSDRSFTTSERRSRGRPQTTALLRWRLCRDNPGVYTRTFNELFKAPDVPTVSGSGLSVFDTMHFLQTKLDRWPKKGLAGRLS